MTDSFLLTLSDGRRYPYRLVFSSRAKYIRIKLSNTGELSVTLPKRYAQKKAHYFISSKTDWIEKQLSRLPEKSAFDSIPPTIALELIEQSWSVELSKKTYNGVILEVSAEKQLTISGQIDDIEMVKKVINKWMQKMCRPIFSSMMQEIAEEHGFYYKRLSIRSQKTRWGSCSSDKNINLNSKLLMMPEDVVRYVMIHELCHTLEMNHSPRFWALVEECDPLFKQHRKKLKEYGATIFL